MSDYSDLVKRLRAWVACVDPHDAERLNPLDTAQEAADALEAQEAKIKELETALVTGGDDE